jgi:hypothetical protein
MSIMLGNPCITEYFLLLGESFSGCHEYFLWLASTFQVPQCPLFFSLFPLDFQQVRVLPDLFSGLPLGASDPTPSTSLPRVLVRPSPSRPSSFLGNYPRVFPDPSPRPQCSTGQSRPAAVFLSAMTRVKAFPPSRLVFPACSSVWHQKSS